MNAPARQRRQSIEVRTTGRPAGADLRPLAALLLQLDQRSLKLVPPTPHPK